MADKTVSLEIKSNIGATAKDAGELANEFKFMGVSLNDIKGGFTKLTSTAAKSFSSIKAGLISTGIGAFVVAVGSLVTYFTQTKRGAELLETTLAGLGAAFNVIVDRVSKFGDGIVKLFKGDTKGALEDVKGTFKDIGEEIVNDTKQALALKDAFQKLRDSNRDLNVETAKRRSEIEELKLIAEDVTKSEEERLEAAEKAFDIENELLDKRIANAEEELRIQKEENALGESKAEDLDKEADLEINLFNIKQESITKQIELNNKINGIKREAEAKELQALKDLQAADKERMGTLEKLPVRTQETNDQIIQSDAELTEQILGNTDKQVLSLKDLEDFKIHAAQQALDIGLTVLDTEMSSLESSYQKERQLAEKNGGDLEAIDQKFEKKRKRLAKQQKAFKVAQALVNTYTSATAAYNQAMDGIPAPAGLIAAPIAAGLSVAAGLANVRQILKQDTGGGAGGGGGGGGGGMGGGQPAPDMQSGKFELSAPAQEQEPVKAFVVTDDVTQGQDKLSTIRRNAVI